MQQLHLVGFTTDLEGLIFSARKGTKSGGYFVVLDDRLRATVEDVLRLRDGSGAGDDGDGSSGRPRRPRPESTLSPREIQARLRTGSTVAEVAAEAGVDEEWVSRFAVPILAEQAQVVGRARALTFVKPRLGASAHPLGVAVRWNLADKGVRLLDHDYDAAWSAYNLQGASWVVRFQYVSRQKRHVAEWEVDLRENELYSRNRTASELGYLDPSRRRRRPPVLAPSPRDAPAHAAEAARPAATRPEPEPAPAPGSGSPTARSAGPVQAARPGAGRRSATSAPATRAAAARTSSSSKGRPTATAKAGKPAKATKKSTAKKNIATKKGATTKKGTTAKAGRATASRRTAATKRDGRPQRAMGKKRGPAHPASVEVPPRTPTPPSAAPDPLRPSHIARPPSPMPAARRGTAMPFAARPTPRPAATPPPARRPEPAPASPPPAPPPPPVEEPPSVVVRRPPPPPRALPGAGVGGNGAATPARSAQPPSPDRRLAERLAAQSARRTRPERPPTTSTEPVWHGPGSGEPAPSVRIRADLAAGTIRPTGEVPRRRRRPPLSR